MKSLCPRKYFNLGGYKKVESSTEFAQCFSLSALLTTALDILPHLRIKESFRKFLIARWVYLIVWVCLTPPKKYSTIISFGLWESLVSYHFQDLVGLY
jgi:hypothetical protein